MSEYKPSPELQALMDFDLLSVFPTAEQIADAIKSSIKIAMTEALKDIHPKIADDNLRAEIGKIIIKTEGK